jgi:D-3-phosphoglycerate dehydrogenase
MRVEILLLESLVPEAKGWLEVRHAVDYQPALADDMSALRKAIYKTQALVVPARVMVNRELLDFAPKLRVIGRMHDGTENIDLEACQERRVRVIQASNATVRAHAEYLLTSLLLQFRRGLGISVLNPSRADARLGRELNGSVVGLFGLAPAAHTLAAMLAPLGVRLMGYDPAVHHSATIWKQLGIQPVSLPEMLQAADAVSVQIIYASRYRGLINERVLSHCKPGQTWVSVSRASLFDTLALADALKDGRIEACMMDSVDSRLTSVESPLRGVSNLLLTPRVAAHTRESRERGSWYLVDRIHEALTLPGNRPDLLMSMSTAPSPLSSETAPRRPVDAQIARG